MKFVLLALLAAVLIFAGCASQQAGNGQNAALPTAVQERTGTGVEPAQQAASQAGNAPQKAKTSCVLTLTPDTINAGDAADIGFSVYSDGNTKFTYNCGGEVREISAGGLITGSRLCNFMQPGEQTVWIKAEGELCAQKTLTVKASGTAKSCYINQSSVKKDLQAYSYEATVHFDGFAPGDKLVWICDRTTATKTLVGSSAGMPRQETISCDYNGRPANDYITVSVAGIDCGRISTR